MEVNITIEDRNDKNILLTIKQGLPGYHKAMVHLAGEDPETSALAVEWFPGDTLDERLRDTRRERGAFVVRDFPLGMRVNMVAEDVETLRKQLAQEKVAV